MSNNIGRTEVAASQNQKEVTINNADGRMDAALTEVRIDDYVSGNITLTASQFQQAVTFETLNLTVARDLTVPLIKKLFVVDNTAGTATLTVKIGTGSVAVPTTETRLCYTDGTTNGIIEVGAAGGGGSALTIATVTTTDATQTDLTTITLAAGEGKVVRGYGIGFEPATEDAIHFDVLVGGANTGGTSRFQGKKITELTEAGSPPEANWGVDADVDDTGDTIRIRVTGEAAKTINWEIQFETITKS